VSDTIRILHVTEPLDAPICPKCGGGHEDDGGPVTRRGSWNDGPFYWECYDCEEWYDGHLVPVQWGHV
jgi:hypothetical protein